MKARRIKSKCRSHDDGMLPAFDAEAALARVDGNRELLWPMVAVFARQWRALLDEIATASQQRDGAALEIAAHRLDESVRSFGAHEASRVAQELDARGRKGDFHDVKKTCAILRAAIDRLVNGLKEFTQKIGTRAPTQTLAGASG
jgi:HPt (histidine-containing phosphotransfer) domain-containing protein